MPRITNQCLRSRAGGPLSTLEYLDLSNLQIDAVERLSQCPKLQTLILRGNRICFVSNFDHCPNLWHLDLGSNQIQSLVGLRKFLALGTLILSDNDISWCELSELRLTHILNLSLHGNKQLERDPYYRIHVIDSLPNVWALDGRIITSAERIQVKQFFQESALSNHPVRHKLCQDAYLSQMKDSTKTRVYGARATHMVTSFPVNAMNNIDMDKKKLKYLAFNLQSDLELQRKYTKCEMMVLEQKGNFLEAILEGRTSDRERCNMMLVLLVGSLQFILPTHLVKETLDTAKLTKFNDVYSMALFLLPREVRCRVVSVLLGAVKIDKDDKEDGGLYDKLYLCLFHTISELTRISQSCDVSGAAKSSKQKSLFKDNKVLLASEIVQLMCLVPAFYEYITKDSGVGNLVITATRDGTILDAIRTIFNSSDEGDLQKNCETIYALLVEAVEANLLEMSSKRPKVSPGEMILHEGRALPMKTYKTPTFSSFHAKGLSSLDLESATGISKKLLIGLPQPFPHLGDVVLLGPQTVGKVISLPQPFLGLVGIDAIPMTNGAMEYRLRDIDSHYSYVDMTRLEWDPVYFLWKPIGAVGDSEIPESQMKRYTIDTAQAMQTELERRAEVYCEAPRPNSPVSGIKSSAVNTHGACLSPTKPLIYTNMAQSADLGNRAEMSREIPRPNSPDSSSMFHAGSKQIWPPRASSFQRRPKEPRLRPMSSVLKEKLNLSLSMYGRPNSAISALMNGPPPTPTTARNDSCPDPVQEFNRKLADLQRDRSSVSQGVKSPKLSVSNVGDASGNPSIVKSSSRSCPVQDENSIAELDKNSNRSNAVNSQDDGASPRQTAGTRRGADGGASENGGAECRQDLDASQNQNGDASPHQSGEVGDIEDSRQPRAGEAGNSEAVKNEQPATQVDSHKDEAGSSNTENRAIENGVAHRDKAKDTHAEVMSEFLQQYGKRGSNSQSANLRKALHMAQIGTRVSIQMPSINDGASEDHSSRRDEEYTRKHLQGGWQPLVPTTRPPHLGPRSSAGRPKSAAQRGRPFSAVEGNRYIASPRVNMRPDSASAYQRLRVEAWKSSHNAPIMMNSSNAETAVVPYVPRRSKSADHKVASMEASSKILKVKRGNDWLAGGRDIHWEMMRQRPRSSHVPGWKEGLPPSMKRRPRSAVVPQTRKSKPTYAPSHTSTSETIMMPDSNSKIIWEAANARVTAPPRRFPSRIKSSVSAPTTPRISHRLG